MSRSRETVQVHHVLLQVYLLMFAAASVSLTGPCFTTVLDAILIYCELLTLLFVFRELSTRTLLRSSEMANNAYAHGAKEEIETKKEKLRKLLQDNAAKRIAVAKERNVRTDQRPTREQYINYAVFRFVRAIEGYVLVFHQLNYVWPICMSCISTYKWNTALINDTYFVHFLFETT